MQKALFYNPAGKNKTVQCTLCPHNCFIQENNLGACGVRKNIEGKLYSLVYGKAIASHIDPVEKKPLFHFYPGSRIYSYATAGCNFKCSFCQNWEISQISKGENRQVIGEIKMPRQIVEEALVYRCSSIAITYNEPSIQFEYAFDVCKEARKKGLKNVFVSNGYISKGPIGKISRYLDAINIDLKSFSDDFYKKICGARLQPVLDSIKEYNKKGVWVEITTLIIPGENDSDEELKKIAEFIASVDIDMPWHLSRFHPDYKMADKPCTPAKTLHKAYEIGKKAGLKYVYVGNVPGDKLENTYCPACGSLLVKRYGFEIISNNILGGSCKKCKEKIKGFFG